MVSPHLISVLAMLVPSKDGAVARRLRAQPVGQGADLRDKGLSRGVRLAIQGHSGEQDLMCGLKGRKGKQGQNGNKNGLSRLSEFNLTLVTSEEAIYVYDVGFSSEAAAGVCPEIPGKLPQMMDNPSVDSQIIPVLIRFAAPSVITSVCSMDLMKYCQSRPSNGDDGQCSSQLNRQITPMDCSILKNFRWECPQKHFTRDKEILRCSEMNRGQSELPEPWRDGKCRMEKDSFTALMHHLG
ncbi:unnamed protein product [Caretta caretta]